MFRVSEDDESLDTNPELLEVLEVFVLLHAENKNRILLKRVKNFIFLILLFKHVIGIYVLLSVYLGIMAL
ncbi:hypothetical protein ADIARSV_0211 [Arcticibacter svalbardensis MN12-7]|uniref:Uncharacterized protein n=1 Tax=Arcticibacter svalbardensis MN12-7 TaxID=1150600 RepID=R9GYL6_9SPHI|nr:hypothetical protein ADIARSV_0211 [Arcticibacter svalbardensis MN12-7]